MKNRQITIPKRSGENYKYIVRRQGNILRKFKNFLKMEEGKTTKNCSKKWLKLTNKQLNY